AISASARPKSGSSTDNQGAPAATSASATAEPAPPAPNSTTSGRSAERSSLGNAEQNTEPSLVRLTGRRAATTTEWHATRRRAAGLPDRPRRVYLLLPVCTGG